jgi:hypothetical protein
MWQFKYMVVNLLKRKWSTNCRNPTLGLVTKARACKGAGQMWSPGVTFHVLKSVKKCEGMNLHTLEWAPTLGVGVMNFQRVIVGVKFHWIEEFFISLKNFWNLNAFKIARVPILKILGSHLGVPKQNYIWVLASWPGIENTIRGKVVASLSRGYGEFCEFMFACGSSMHQRCSNYALTNLLFGLCRFM